MLKSCISIAEANFGSGDVMHFYDMAGVFYAVMFGLAFSSFALLGELAWATRKDIKQKKVHIFLLS